MMCPTCPFHEAGWKELRGLLVERALNEASPLCHMAGQFALDERGNPLPSAERVSQENMICRGARNFQLNFFFEIGLISEPTDEAWAEKCTKMGIKPPNNYGKKQPLHSQRAG